jgi:hypothetical protein
MLHAVDIEACQLVSRRNFDGLSIGANDVGHPESGLAGWKWCELSVFSVIEGDWEYKK